MEPYQYKEKIPFPIIGFTIMTILVLLVSWFAYMGPAWIPPQLQFLWIAIPLIFILGRDSLAITVNASEVMWVIQSFVRFPIGNAEIPLANIQSVEPYEYTRHPWRLGYRSNLHGNYYFSDSADNIEGAYFSKGTSYVKITKKDASRPVLLQTSNPDALVQAIRARLSQAS